MLEFSKTDDPAHWMAKCLLMQARVKICDCDCPCNCLCIEKVEGDIFGIKITLDDQVVYLMAQQIGEDQYRQTIQQATGVEAKQDKAQV